MTERAPDTGSRVRVVSTRAGYLGRKAGRTFDVTAEEYARHGPDGDGMLRLVDATVTHAAVREAAKRGVNLADVPGKKKTARAVKRTKN